ncbi:DUF881 domain-containing protein [Pelotomaculum terephthalicicum JT]|uniref:DUF881 domain-containing protein n=1 Tax=Pelotomaculum TaxID=191373 RepID=UPI0009D4A08D|nr:MULTISPECIES: DUF881 domain-containing protein [Pelotomaculum]MCG9968073.1 DUF881 domain-containing protein [Pelotomaculum terephthalicicum JT]OPX85628.1 MAG: hypothetical protein A4E54_02328 [Pelotomaculum sp. PtaB.Bin117]OPY64000.1 MAG: hypothetical protein A4E56_00052 [Pelotomaculum sp. PtaU1.Bin065]
MNKSIYFSIALVSLILGLIVAFQFRTTSSIESGVPSGREQELTMEKRQLQKDITQLREEVDDLTAKLEEAGKGSSQATDAFTSELLKIRLYAGLTKVEGPGVEVTLDNLAENARPGGNPNLYFVKDEDLLKIINDLRGAGAEAIAVNNQRILATSEVRLAGNHINVNLTKLTAPYKVTAIGNATTLKSSLEIKGGLVENLSERITVKVEERDNIVIPAFTGELRFDYARSTQRG